jgi:hypothetical protein
VNGTIGIIGIIGIIGTMGIIFFRKSINTLNAYINICELKARINITNHFDIGY